MEINKYHNSKIYKIVSNHTDKIYIGSTTQKYLTSRKGQHKNGYRIFKNNGINYVSSFELIDLGEIDIILIENVKCENKEELLAREKYYFELNKELCVNKNNPSRTFKEWYKENFENNKEKYKEYSKEYYNNNKEIIKKKNKEKFNCECGGKFTKINKLIHLKTKKHLKFINDTLNQELLQFV